MVSVRELEDILSNLAKLNTMLDYIKQEQDDLIDDSYCYDEWLKTKTNN